jgi:hypothetical protein
MDQITFKTENGIFEFDKSDVTERLKYHKQELNSLEADMIEKYLSCGGGGCHHNIVPEEYEYFCIIALELIEKEKGSVICKKCDETYKASELKSITVGHGKTPFDENTGRKKDRLRFRAIFGKRWFRVAIDNIKNPFRKKNSNPPMFGGKGYACPNDHELITLITWRT